MTKTTINRKHNLLNNPNEVTHHLFCLLINTLEVTGFVPTLSSHLFLSALQLIQKSLFLITQSVVTNIPHRTSHHHMAQ